MTKRQDWTFNYEVREVLEAARKQLAYHEQKTQWWADCERAREEDAQRSVTLGEGYDSVAARTTMVAQPKYDQAKLNALYEAQNHRKDHQTKADQYRIWVNILYSQPQLMDLPLQYDDVVFFGLADGMPVEETSE